MIKMLMIKYVILSIILGISIWIGILISKKYKDRVIELTEFRNSLNILENKIKFTYEPLQEIFKQISENLENNISLIFENTNKNLKRMNMQEAWNKAIDESVLNLNKEDISIIKNMGKLLGKTDVEGQISEIKLTSGFIDSQIEKAQKEREKNEKLYKTLGTVVGLAIVIILI